MKKVTGVTNRDKQKYPYGIKPPKTLEEFRDNLEKYYFTLPLSEDEYGKGKRGLYLQEGCIPLDEIISLSSLYNHPHLIENQYGIKQTPSLTPMVSMKKDIGEYMREINQTFSTYGYFFDEDNFTIYDEQKEMMKSDKDMVWVKIDNQIYRELFMITLGEYSGYVFNKGDTFNETQSNLQEVI